MKFYKNLGEALECNIRSYLRDKPRAESVPVFNHFKFMPLPRSTARAAEEICNYCSGENGWYVIESKYIENKLSTSLDYGCDYYVDKETGLILIERVHEYDFMRLYPAILLMKDFKNHNQC